MKKLALLLLICVDSPACGAKAPVPAAGADVTAGADASADAAAADDATNDTAQSGDAGATTDTSGSDAPDSTNAAAADAKADVQAPCTPAFCDDGNPCTTDSCSVNQNCKHTFNTQPCDDGLGCTVGDSCSGGLCLGGTEKSPWWTLDGDGDGENAARALVDWGQQSQLGDNGLIIVGYTTVNSYGGRDGMVRYYAQSGQPLLGPAHAGGAKDDEFWAIAVGPKGFMVAGTTQSSGAGKRDGWLAHSYSIDMPNLIFTTFGGAGDEEFYALAPSAAGYLAAGYSENALNGNLRFWVVSVDQEGKQIWEKKLEGSELDSAYAIAVTGDGGSVAVGETAVDGNEHLLLVRLDKDGNLLWKKSYHDKGFDNGWSIAALSDGFALGGYRIEGTAPKQAWLGRADKDGQLLAEKTYGVGEFRSIVALNDGSVAAGGMVNGAKSLVKIGKDGTVMWQQKYGTGNSGDATIHSVIALDSKGFGMAGVSKLSGKDNMWAARADEKGSASCTK